MKVFVIAHKSPYPIIDGGCFAMDVFLRNLAAIESISTIDYFVISTHKHPFILESTPPDLHSKIKFKSQEVDTKLKLIPAFNHLLRRKSYNLSRFYSDEVFHDIKKMVSENDYDFIFFESLFPAVYLNKIKSISKAKCILRAHNIEYEIWKDLAQNEKFKLKKWYLNQLAKALEKDEKNYLNAFDAVFSISADDTEKIKNLTSIPVSFIPVSIKIAGCKTDYSNSNLAFIGAFNWQPNLEAIHWFLNNLLPLIQLKNHVKIQVAGKECERIQFDKNNSTIEIKGFVESSNDFFQSSGIFIAPIKSGSGVKIKVIEAMSNGLPCVLTPKAAEGLNLSSNYPICENTEKFINLTNELIENEYLRKEIGQLGYEFVHSNYSLQSVTEKLKKELV